MGCAVEDLEAVFVAGGGDERRVPWDRLPELVEEFGAAGTGRSPGSGGVGAHRDWSQR
jgi:hypothetical protein